MSVLTKDANGATVSFKTTTDGADQVSHNAIDYIVQQPIAVSGTVTANVAGLSSPLGVSGTVSIGNVVTVNAHIPQPLAVSGTFNTSFNVDQPLGISGTVSSNIIGLPLPIGVSGTVGANILGLPLPIGVSGTITATQGGAPWSENIVGLPLPIGVSGTVSANILGLPLPIGVSGTITANQGGAPWSQNVIGLPLPVGISGTVSIGNSPTVGIYGPIAISGTVNVSHSLPVGVSGTVSANVISLPLPIGVSGTVNIGTIPIVNVSHSLPIGVSGTVSSNIIGLPLPVGISGTVGINALPLPIGVSGTITANQGGVWNVGQTAGPWAVSGTLSAHILDLPNPLGVSGTIQIQVGGVAPGLDNTNELKVSLYAKKTSAGDTALTTDVSGNLNVALNSQISGEDFVLGRMTTVGNYTYKTVTASGNTQVKAASGLVHTISVATKSGAAGSLVLYDNTSPSGTIIGTFDVTASICHTIDAQFNTGLFASFTGTLGSMSVVLSYM